MRKGWLRIKPQKANESNHRALFLLSMETSLQCEYICIIYLTEYLMEEKVPLAKKDCIDSL